MAIDFCNSLLGSKILCRQVSTETYEIENLISNNVAKKHRGFLASSFVRPPVDIIVQFPCPVNISCLIINGKLGIQQTTGCEVFAQDEPPAGSYDAFNQGTFRNIGKFYWDCQKKGVHVAGVPHSGCSAASEEDYVCHKLSKSLSGTWSLRLTLLRTASSSVPALAHLEIWGFVAFSAEPQSARNVIETWFNLKHPRVRTETKLQSEPVAVITRPMNDKSVPEEFLDGLTFEVMALPVRLPSGNVIDEQNLEKYTRHEAQWGRSASDPFTGQLLNNHHKPVYDTALKARIDTFLLHQSDHPGLVNIPRTTGPVQRSFEFPNEPSRVSCYSARNPLVVSNSSKSVAATSSHRFISNLADNLSRLSRSSTSTSIVRAVKATSAAACGCGGRTDGVYSLPCSHFICRACLLESKKKNVLECGKCQKPFVVDQPVRVHC